MTSKTALVTGVSSGFGLAIVKDLLAHGWQVIAACRNCAARSSTFREAAEHYPEHLHLVELDVTEPAHMDALVQKVQTDFGGRLDLLVNNAGFGTFGALEDMAEDQLRRQFEVNFFAPAFLIRRLLPALRAAQGRIINVTSIMGMSSMPLASVYSSSKYALEGLSEALYFELKPLGVQLCTIQPGGHRTNFMKSSHWGEKSDLPSSPYHQMTLRFQRMRDRLLSRPKAPQPERVSETVIKLLAKKRMPRAVLVGQDARLMGTLKALLPVNVLPLVLTSAYGKILRD